MGISTKDNNLFRYIHFRPAQLTDKLAEKLKTEAEEIRPHNENRNDKHQVLDSPIHLREKRIRALKNLEILDLSRDVELSDNSSFLMLNDSGTRKLSDQTKDTLKSLGLDRSTMTHLELINGLNSVLANPDNNPPTFSPEPNPTDSDGYIKDVGIAKLLVVKQQILRYEASEIAHIENVIAGETKTRTHTNSLRSEEFSSIINDSIKDTETELETSERFELNNQASNIFQKDTELGMDLTLSGKYGPTVSFDSNFNAGQTTSQTKSNEQATNFAKDTIERSKERIVKQITETKETKIIRELKEENIHIINNTAPDSSHRHAIFQYLDKVYKNQVFDYGIRQMFDFMIPEPSSYLWYLKGKTAFELDMQPPKNLKDMGIEGPKQITKYNYQSLGAQYAVNDLPTPPEIFITKRIKVAHGDGSITDEKQHKTGVSETLDIPQGYQPHTATYVLLATSDETPSFFINIGGNITHKEKDDLEELEVQGEEGHSKYKLTNNNTISLGHTNTLVEDQKLFIDIYGYESANYTFHFEVTFYALYDTSQLEYFIVSAWKQEVYGQLVEAYQTSLQLYEQEKSYLEAEAAAEDRGKVDFGNPPAVNKKQIHTELKKHCLAIIRNKRMIQDEHMGTLHTSQTGEPPEFSLSEAKENGKKIRFLEQAFEWDQMQYVFYPYFWARPNFNEHSEESLDGWNNKFFERNNDFTMEEFLKAGSARVVVPVREGLDLAVSHFIETGKVYNGLGEPQVTDPLYISITDEIKERTDAGKDEIPVGESWDTRIPTSAIIVKDVDELPEWTLDQDTVWDWVPNE